MKFKKTKYFEYVYSTRADKKIIKEEWIIETINYPDYEKTQKDGRIRK